jgi:tripartite-type tricarboxylate transporter receptor subunit TctC
MNAWIKRLLALVALVGAAAVSAQGYPNKTIRLVVPYPAGGTLDALTRTLAPELSKELGQQVIVDNRAGASGMIGTGEVARADPDGYTLLMVFDAHATHKLLNKALPYDPVTSFEPIALLIKTPMLIIANVGYGPNNLKELVANARANPGRVTYGSVGVGSSTHLYMAQFERLLGLQMLHVPYKGGAPAMQDLIGGQFNIMIASPAFTKQGLASGRVKLLGQMGPTRSAMFPDLPNNVEQGVAPDFEATLWMGISAPKGTPAAVVQRWKDALAKVTKIREVNARLQQLGLDVNLGSAEEFGKLVASDERMWRRLVEQMGLKLE